MSLRKRGGREREKNERMGARELESGRKILRDRVGEKERLRQDRHRAD